MFTKNVETAQIIEIRSIDSMFRVMRPPIPNMALEINNRAVTEIDALIK